MEKRKMTILLLGNAKSIHTLRWAGYFSRKGYNVHLITYGSPICEDVQGVKINLIGRSLPIKLGRINTLINLPIAVWQTRRIIKKIKPDILNAHYATSYGQLAVLSGFRPFILTAWGSDILIAPKESWIVKKVVSWVLFKAKIITCDAEHMKKAIIKLGAKPDKVRIIYFGVDTEKFKPGEKDEKLTKKIGASGCQVVISLRNLNSLYDIETLIKSTPIILEKKPKTKFIIAGKGSCENKLKKMVKDLKLEESVKFVGYIANQDLPRYLKTADVYVSTSLSDAGISSSTAEAMSSGLALVITDSGENNKWIKNNDNGFIVPTKNPKLLADRVTTLLNDEKLRKSFGKKARKMIEQKNNYCKEMEKMEELYKQLLNE